MLKYNKLARKKVYDDLLVYINNKETELNLNKHNITVIGPKDKVHQEDNINPFILSIVNTDTLDATINIINKNKLKTGFIIMASDKYAGGGVANGALAQEEDIARRCDIANAYNKISYPLRQFETVIIDKLQILCENETNNYAKLDKPIESVGLLAPAFRNPKLIEKDDYEKYTICMKRKIKILLNAALYAKCENVVLGAWGCGAFHNPPRDVAECFRDVLIKYKYKFKTVTFAILDNKWSNNMEIFKSVLEHNDNTSFLQLINKNESENNIIKQFSCAKKNSNYVKVSVEELENLSDIFNKH